MPMINKNVTSLFFLKAFFILAVFSASFYMIHIYFEIACSTAENNICYAAYEPSGVQLLGYYLIYPAWFFISVTHYIQIKSRKLSAVSHIIFGSAYVLIVETLNFIQSLNLFYKSSALATIPIIILSIINLIYVLNIFIISYKKEIRNGTN